MFKNLIFTFTSFLLLTNAHAYAQSNIDPSPCIASDRACVIDALIEASDAIENPNWRDQSYREIAKTLTAERRFDDAIAVWEKIENPDTKAMTIRGIGMKAADLNLGQSEYDALFQKLRDLSETISHPPSYAIALTYIAMSQAFAGDDEGAWKTALSMENDALRHKAFGETAEIQAEKGHFDAAMKSIGYIESPAFRNKAYALVSKIMTDQNMFNEALVAANSMDNAYKKAHALQYILNKQDEDNGISNSIAP